ncbi:MAG: hypothetical protein QME71_09275 [Dehalococcoidia bacterium]|nr:hypothetical protein [Dehalococcoidia bacterium]
MTDEEPGPFDKILRQEPERRDRRAPFVIGAMIVLGLFLLVLVLPPVSILSGGGGDGDGGAGEEVKIEAKARKNMPSLPEGLEAVTPLYDISVSGEIEGPTQITLSLPSPLGNARGLSFYTFEDGEWRRIASVRLALEGAAAQADLAEIPGNLAVLKSTGAPNELSGWLPAGSQLNAEAAPLLSVLNPVAFAPAFDGSLIGEAPAPPEGEPAYEVQPSVRASTPEETEAVNAIMGSPDLRDAHIDAILEMAESGPYGGVDIDYGALDPLRRDEFTEFVAALAEQLHRRDLALTLTAPLPILQGSEWDTGAYDWQQLAAAADTVKIRPDPDPSRYYRKMEQALDFLIKDQKIPPAKLSLVLSPWAHEKGGEGIRNLSLLEALSIAGSMKLDRDDGPVAPGGRVRVLGENICQEDGASGIHWDEEAAAVSFTYPGLGGARTVWIENSFSFAFRLNLVSRFHLAGVALEDVSTGPGLGDIWPLLDEFMSTGKASLAKPNGTMLAPQWEAEAGEIQDAGDGSITWKAPDEPGTYRVALIVSDGLARLGQRLSIDVGE